MSVDNLLWVEKYKPHNIEQSILPSRIKDYFRSVVETGEIRNHTFVGSQGCGKTSLAKALLEQMGIEYLYINASEDNNIDTIRTTVRGFASRMSFSGGYKVILLDEAGGISKIAQRALLAIIEEFQVNCRFILTANQTNSIDDALLSRCPPIEFIFTPSEKKEMVGMFFKRMCDILNESNIVYDKKELLGFILKMFPDFRASLNILQRLTHTGTLVLTGAGGASDEKMYEVIGYLRKSEWTNMRKWCAENLDTDTTTIRRALYDKMYEYLHPDSVPSIVLVLNDFDSREPNVKDKEIHMVAMMTEIINECTFK